MKQERKGRSAQSLDSEGYSPFDPTPEEEEAEMSFADGQSYGDPSTPPYKAPPKKGNTGNPPHTPLPIPPPASCGLCTFFKLGAIGVVIWYFLRKG